MVTNTFLGTVHEMPEYVSSETVYDLCNCECPKYKTGDIIIIPSEKIVAIAWAWPMAITAEFGDLHSHKAGMEGFKTLEGGRFAAAAEKAAKIAEKREWPLCVKTEDADY